MKRLTYLLGLAALLAGTLLAACGESTSSKIVTSSATSSVPGVKPVSLTLTPTVRKDNTDWQLRWLKGIPCRPPCWEGITPGSTTSSEAVKLLQQNSMVKNVKISEGRNSSPYTGSITWDWLNGDLGGQIYYGYPNQNPSRIIHNIMPYYSTTLKLSEIIKAYGEPSHVIATTTKSERGDSISSNSLNLIYLSQGFSIWNFGKNKPELSPNLILNGPGFFVATDKDLPEVFSINPQTIILWQGFKDFDFYCRELNGSSCH